MFPVLPRYVLAAAGVVVTADWRPSGVGLFAAESHTQAKRGDITYPKGSLAVVLSGRVQSDRLVSHIAPRGSLSLLPERGLLLLQVH